MVRPDDTFSAGIEALVGSCSGGRAVDEAIRHSNVVAIGIIILVVV